MKRLLPLFFLIAMAVSAQEAETQSKTGLRFDPGYRVGWSQPIATGTTVLSEGYKPGWGVNFELDLFSYRNWMLGVGSTFAGFNVTDRQVVGTFSNALYSSLYGAVSYRYAFTERWSLIPSISAGAASFDMTGSQNLKISSQKGQEYRIGSTLNYRFGHHTAAYVGLFYARTHVGMNTTPEFEDFYSNLSQVQLQVGIYFH